MTKKMKILFTGVSVCFAALIALAPGTVRAEDLTANEMVQRITTEVLNEIHTDKKLQEGNIQAATRAVDRLVIPNIDFPRMTAAAVGPAWRSATPEQRKEVIEEFKALLIRTYVGSLNEIGNLHVEVLPMRPQPDPNDVLVQSRVLGGDKPIQLDYRLQRTPGEGYGWKVYNVNVMGAWIVNSYRNQFQQEINANGIEGLIKTLRSRNM